MTKKVIIDKVLSPEVFRQIQDYMLGLEYRWYFGAGVADPDDTENFQFIHKIHER